MREILYRADRIARPKVKLPLRAIQPDDGWCDAPNDPNYNRLVKLPWRASAESLWRDDALYDLVAVLGFNDAPVMPGKGSAIFLHVARPDYSHTHGCVALAFADALAALEQLQPGDAVVVARVTSQSSKAEFDVPIGRWRNAGLLAVEEIVVVVLHGGRTVTVAQVRQDRQQTLRPLQLRMPVEHGGHAAEGAAVAAPDGGLMDGGTCTEERRAQVAPDIADFVVGQQWKLIRRPESAVGIVMDDAVRSFPGESAHL